MKAKIFATAASAVALCACLFGIAGCGGTSPDVDDIKGVWEIEGSNPELTVVFTGEEWKLYDTTYTYTLDTNAKKIDFEVANNTDMKGEATYEFSEDRNTLTFQQQDDNGSTKTTVFDKVSDDTSAEPTYDGKKAS